MSEELLDDMIKSAYELAAKTLIGTRNDLFAQFILVSEQNEISVFACPWANDKEKQVAVGLVRREVHKKKPAAYAFVTEAWTYTDHAYQGPPSKHPNRKEIVLCLAVNPTEKKMESWDIVRDNFGRCVALTITDGKTPAGYFSWLANLYE